MPRGRLNLTPTFFDMKLCGPAVGQRTDFFNPRSFLACVAQALPVSVASSNHRNIGSY